MNKKVLFQHLDSEIHPETDELYLFGRTIDGTSVAVNVGQVRPHFCVKGKVEYASFVRRLILYHYSKRFFKHREKNVPKCVNPNYYLDDIPEGLVELQYYNGQDLCEFNEAGTDVFTKLTFKDKWLMQSAKTLMTSAVNVVVVPSEYKKATVSREVAKGLRAVRSEALGLKIYNDQVNTNLQWFIDNDIYSCNFLEVYGVRPNEIRTTCEVELDTTSISSIKQEGMVDWKILSYDIETLPQEKEGGGIRFGKPETDPIITISGVMQGKGRSRQCVWVLTNNGEEFHKLKALEGEKDGFDPSKCEVYSFDDEIEMLEDFINNIVQEDVDFIEGHNISRYDNDYLLKRYQTLKGGPCYIGRFLNVKSTITKKTFSSKQKGKYDIYKFYIPGRVIFDSYSIMKDQHKEGSYKLDDLAETYLGTKKIPFAYEDIPKCYRTKEGRHKLAVYCLKDSWLVREMMKKLCKVTVYVQMASVTGISIKDVIERGQGIRAISLMLRYAKTLHFFIPRKEVYNPRRQVARNVINASTNTVELYSETVEAEEGYAGAVVVDPDPGFYDDPVVCLDFASLYPSIMRALNMSYDTLVSYETVTRMGWKEGVEFRCVPDYEYVDGKLNIVKNLKTNVLFATTKVRVGLLCQILKAVLAERKAVKKTMKTHDPSSVEYQVLDGRQLGLKVVANSIYGFTGAKFGFLYEKRIASSVTKFGRGMILSTKSYIENHAIWGKVHGLKCVYGDTDSVFVHFKRSFIDPGGKMTDEELIAESHKVGEAMAAEVTKIFLPPNDLEYEKTYYPFLLLKKKRYAGEKHEPGHKSKVHVRGLESVRRDYAPLCVEVQKKILRFLLDRAVDKEARVNNVKNYISSVVHDLNKNNIPLEKLIMSMTLSRKPAEYKNKAAHVNLAIRLQRDNPITAPQSGDRVPYVIHCGGGNISERGCTPEEIRSGKYVVDRHYYLQRQLQKPISRIVDKFLSVEDTADLFRPKQIVKDKIHASNKFFASFKTKDVAPKRKFTASSTKQKKKYKTQSLGAFFKIN